MKTLVLFVFHELNNRVLSFLNTCIFRDDSIDFVVICNNPKLHIDIPDYVKLIKRDNIGYDFGGWSEAVLTNDTYKLYDSFIFVNSSVIGPFRNDKKWTDYYLEGLDDTVKLFGSTINTRKDPLHKSHVQSYIFAMKRDTLQYLIDQNIFSLTNHAKTFTDAIWNKEVLMSRLIIQKGWNIGSLLNYYKGIDFTFKKQNRSITYLDDVMYPAYSNSLWKKEDLVFIKGNRGTMK